MNRTDSSPTSCSNGSQSVCGALKAWSSRWLFRLGLKHSSLIEHECQPGATALWCNGTPDAIANDDLHRWCRMPAPRPISASGLESEGLSHTGEWTCMSSATRCRGSNEISGARGRRQETGVRRQQVASLRSIVRPPTASFAACASRGVPAPTFQRRGPRNNGGAPIRRRAAAHGARVLRPMKRKTVAGRWHERCSSVANAKLDAGWARALPVLRPILQVVQ